ncbi:MAG: hypothetical protein O3A00_15625 [Planctomycetota bacterium]|nr:hypothetical protein [Planctomycetota bacterium]
MSVDLTRDASLSRRRLDDGRAQRGRLDWSGNTGRSDWADLKRAGCSRRAT